MNAFLAKVNTPVVNITANLLLTGRSYQIQLTTTNWLGTTASAIHVVEKLASDVIPEASLPGGNERLVSAEKDFFAYLDVKPSMCGDALVEQTLVYAWELLEGEVLVIPESSLSAATFHLPRNTFAPGQAYIFQVSITDFKNPDLILVELSLAVTVVSSPLVAIIAGGDQMHSLPGTTELVLDGTASKDPDLTSSTQQEDIEWTWSCTTAIGGPCFSPGDHESFLSVTAINYIIPNSALELLGGTTITFTLSLVKKSRTVEYSVAIEITKVCKDTQKRTWIHTRTHTHTHTHTHAHIHAHIHTYT
jgi:hypothetical protein